MSAGQQLGAALNIGQADETLWKPTVALQALRAGCAAKKGAATRDALWGHHSPVSISITTH
jgi:hypothetical protein